MSGAWSSWPNALAMASALLVAAPVAGAENARDLRRLFAKAAAIELGAGGPSRLQRLELPSEVLASCRGDLSDVRIVDTRGAEVPFLVERKRSEPATQRVGAQVLHAERQRKPRGAPGSVENAQHVERYDLAAPPPPPQGSAWDLVLESQVPHFVRRLDVESLDRAGRAARLVEGGSAFRLPDAHAERLRFPLGPGPVARLRVTFSSDVAEWLNPRFAFESVEPVDREQRLVVPLEIVEQSRSSGFSRFVVSRPLGIVPSAVRLTTSTPAFVRRVEVRDAGPGAASRLLGSAYVFDVPAPVPVEEFEVRLETAASQLLSVSLEDRDSPPLDAVALAAVIRAPALVFVADPSAAPTLYFGGGRAHAPRYDLAALQGELGDDGAVAPALKSLRKPAELSTARLGTIADNPAFDRSPALAFARRPGRVVDARLYTHRRELSLTPSSDGLAEIALSSSDVALLRADFADVRVVDASLRQWPYWLEPKAQRDSITLIRSAPQRKGRESHTTLGLAVRPLALSGLVLDAEEPYFDRAYRLLGKAPSAEPAVLASGRLIRAAHEPERRVTIDFAESRLESLVLVVEDADNAPLSWRSIRANTELPALFVVAAPGAYTLLLGNADDEKPRYDIEAARTLLLSVASHPNRPGPLTANPAFSERARFTSGSGLERTALWGVIIAAVALLGALTLRLARAPTQSP